MTERRDIQEYEGFDRRVWTLHRQGLSKKEIAEQLVCTPNEAEESIRRLADDPPK
jgi:hypothetical protein